MTDTRKKLSNTLKNEGGAVIILVAVSLVLLAGMTALAVDLSYRHVVRNELQNIADAAALAGARQLGVLYPESYQDQQNYDVVATGDRDQIVDVIQQTAVKNQAGAKLGISIPSGDILIGLWDFSTRTFTEASLQPDAVKVVVRRDDTANSPVGTFFASVFGIDSMSIVAEATAALSGQSTAEPGELELPIGISKNWFDEHAGDGDDYCGKTIKFSPSTDPDACAGWNTFDDDPANDNKVRDILDGIITNNETTADSVFEYINGDLSANTFEALMTAFQVKGHDVTFQYDPNNLQAIPQPVAAGEHGEPLYDTDGTTQLQYPPCQGASGCTGELRYSHEWPTTVTVYDSDDCTPNGSIRVAGFAQVVVYDVGAPSNKTVAARIECDYVDSEPTRGGGGNYGKKGSIPGLVD